MQTTTVAQRVQKHRNALRSAGLRPVQIWVPDTRSAGFAEECRRQSLLLVNNKEEDDVLNYIEGMTDTEGWE